MRNITVLVSAAGNVFMPGTSLCLREIKDRKIRIIGTDINNDSSILHMFDSVYTVPSAGSPEYVGRILEICKKEHVDIVIPVMSAELEPLSIGKERFREIGTCISVSDIEPLTIANDKIRFLDYLRNNGFQCAQYYNVRSLGELEARVRELGYGEKKICVKTTHSSGSRGFRIISEEQTKYERFVHNKPDSSTISLKEMIEILSEAEQFPELLVMEYLPGQEYTVDLVANKKDVLCCCCRRSLRMENSIMIDSIVEDNKQIIDLCTDITTRLGLEGNIGFDVRERADGTPIIMECNPRITAGAPIFLHAGVNLININICRILGEFESQSLQTKPKAGVVVIRRWNEYLQL